MAFNGSGTFLRIFNWQTDASNSIVITASRFDTEDNGFATGLSNTICRDGQSTVIANIPWNGNKITGLGNPTAAQDVVNVRSASLGFSGRLTLTTGTPIITGSVTGAGTVYFTPYGGNSIPIYNGTVFIQTTFIELSNVLANSSTGNAGPAAAVASSTYDLYVWSNSGTLTLTRSPAWTSSTSRGTGPSTAEQQVVNGVTTNKQAITNGPTANLGTWVGTIVTDASGATVSVTMPPAVQPPNSQSVFNLRDGDVIAAAYAAANIVGAGGFVNKFRNGTMDTFSRGASATVTTAGAYTADGWIVLPTGASVTVAKSAARSITTNSLQITGATSVADVIVKQRIESFMCAPLSGQTVTVQAQVFNNTGGSITPTLTVIHPTATDNYTSTTTDVNAATLQTCTNSAWTQVSYTFTAASQIFGLEISFDFGNNFSSNAKSIKITECDIRVTPGAATGQINPNPPPPELRPIGVEMPLNQRYYWTSLPGVVPGNGSQAAQTMTANSTAAQQGAFLFPVPMRGTPTITMYSTSTGTSGKAFDVTASSDISVTPSGFTNMAVTLPFNGASPALVSTHTYTWYTTASSEI